MKEKAGRKSEQMKKIFQDSKDIEAIMKEKIKKSMAEAATRQVELAKEQHRVIQ